MSATKQEPEMTFENAAAMGRAKASQAMVRSVTPSAATV